MEFVCEHCSGKSLRLIEVADRNVGVECLSCGKESMVKRDAASTPAAQPQTES